MHQNNQYLPLRPVLSISKNETFPTPHCSLDTKESHWTQVSLNVSLFQMRFSVTNHSECLPDHLDSESEGQHRCLCAIEQLSGKIMSQTKKWNWHLACW